MKRNLFVAGVVALAIMRIGPAAAQDCVEPPAGLVSWWPADGNADDIQNGNHGTLVGGAGFAPGMVGEAFRLDGLDDHVLIGNPANLKLQDFTIDAWVKPDRLDYFDFCNILTYGVGGYEFGFYSETRPVENREIFLGKKDFSDVHGAPVPDTSWHHVAATKSGSVVVLYLDGVAFPMPPFNPGFSFTSNLAIGIEADLPVDDRMRTGRAFDGLIDELEIYDRALLPSEILAIFEAGSAGKCKETARLDCRLDLDPGPYAQGEVVEVEGIRVSNDLEPRLAEVKIWIDAPDAPTIPILNEGADAGIPLESAYSEDIGGLLLFEVDASTAPGEWELGCRMLDQVTGETLVVRTRPFQVE